MKSSRPNACIVWLGDGSLSDHCFIIHSYGSQQESNMLHTNPVCINTGEFAGSHLDVRSGFCLLNIDCWYKWLGRGVLFRKRLISCKKKEKSTALAKLLAEIKNPKSKTQNWCIMLEENLPSPEKGCRTSDVQGN